MAGNIRLTPGQLEAMEVLWDRGHASVREIHSELMKKRMRTRGVVFEMLMRMKRLRYIRARMKDGAYDFTPLIERSSLAE